MLLEHFTLTTKLFEDGYGWIGGVALAVVVTMALYGFYVTIRGRSGLRQLGVLPSR
jgi:hypothetical protein